MKPENKKRAKLEEEIIMFKKTATRIAATAIAMTAAVSGLSATASAYTVTYNYQPTAVYQPVRRTVPMRVPANLGSYHCNGIVNVSQNIAQATYYAGGKQIVVRKANGSTGLANNYPGTLRTSVNGWNVTYKGTTAGYYTATWSRNGYNYIVKSNKPLNKTQMDNTVKTMLNA